MGFEVKMGEKKKNTFQPKIAFPYLSKQEANHCLHNKNNRRETFFFIYAYKLID